MVSLSCAQRNDRSSAAGQRDQPRRSHCTPRQSGRELGDIASRLCVCLSQKLCPEASDCIPGTSTPNKHIAFAKSKVPTGRTMVVRIVFRVVANQSFTLLTAGVEVMTKVFGFFKIRNNSILDTVDVDSEPWLRDSTGFWVDLSQRVLDVLRLKNILVAEVCVRCHFWLKVLSSSSSGHPFRSTCFPQPLCACAGGSHRVQGPREGVHVEGNLKEEACEVSLLCSVRHEGPTLTL